MKLFKYLLLAVVGLPVAAFCLFSYVPVTENTARPYFTVACAGLKQLGHISEAGKRGGHIEQIDCACIASEFVDRMGRDQFARTVEKARIRTNDYLAWQLSGRVGEPKSSIPVPDRDLDQALSLAKDMIEAGRCVGPNKA